ncbi:MAG: rhodanese-like domain-containing protein [Terrimicrobiaceae bacterium]
MTAKSTLTILVLLAAVIFILRPAFAIPSIPPTEAMEKVKSGGAVLIDVREPAEWGGGVVEGALLLPLSDLKGPRTLWAVELDKAKGREIVVYCRSGNRSGIAGGILQKEGWTVWNAGGFSSWVKAGVPTKKP